MKDIDFIPEWYKVTQKRKRSYHRQYILLTVLFALMMAWSFVIGRHVSHVQAEVKDMRLASEVAKMRVDQVLALESEIAVLTDQTTILETITPRTKLSAILAEISFLAGDNVILSKLTATKEAIEGVEKKEPAAGSAAMVTVGKPAKKTADTSVAGVPSRMKIVLTGIAASAADAAGMLSRLENSQYFEDVAPVFSKTRKIKEHNVTEFEIRCYVADYKQVK